MFCETLLSAARSGSSLRKSLKKKIKKIEICKNYTEQYDDQRDSSVQLHIQIT